MTNTVFDVINQLRTILITFEIPVYKEVMKVLGKCFVITYLPIKKNNLCSTNDMIVLLYLPKIIGLTDMAGVEKYSSEISAKLKDFSAINGMINFNENIDPFTDNFDSNYTVTTFKIRTINY